LFIAAFAIPDVVQDYFRTLSRSELSLAAEFFWDTGWLDNNLRVYAFFMYIMAAIVAWKRMIGPESWDFKGGGILDYFDYSKYDDN
jgi:hypothetical protein